MNPKAIGNSYEREFSKKLSLWATEGKDDSVFYRDLSSGARATVRKKQGKETPNKGDIIAVDLHYKWFTDIYFIDTKTTKDPNFDFTNPSNQKSNFILNEWKKVVGDTPQNCITVMPVKPRNRKFAEIVLFPLNFDCNTKEFLTYSGGEYPSFKVMNLGKFFSENSFSEMLDFYRNR
jgi:hypothetical protein